MKTPKWIEKKSIKMGEKKKEEKMEMSTIKQKKRKEDFSESKSEVKKPSPEKKKVCKPFDYYAYFVTKLIITINP